MSELEKLLVDVLTIQKFTDRVAASKNEWMKLLQGPVISAIESKIPDGSTGLEMVIQNAGLSYALITMAAAILHSGHAPAAVYEVLMNAAWAATAPAAPTVEDPSAN